MPTVYYDRPYYVSIAIDISRLKPADKKAVQAFLEKEYETFSFSYPSDLAIKIAEELPSKGHKAFAAATPYEITLTNMNILFSKCIEAFNPKALIRRVPDFSRIKKEIKNKNDYTRIVDELLLQQDNIALSQIFDTGTKPKIAIVSESHPVNARLSRIVLDMGEELIGKSKMNETLEKLKEDIAEGFKQVKEIEEQIRTDSKYSL